MREEEQVDHHLDDAQEGEIEIEADLDVGNVLIQLEQPQQPQQAEEAQEAQGAQVGGVPIPCTSEAPGIALGCDVWLLF